MPCCARRSRRGNRLHDDRRHRQRRVEAALRAIDAALATRSAAAPKR
jgi:hypothetical protein